MPKPNCTATPIEFDRLGRRIIETNFQGGDLTSDGGLLLLRRFDKKIGLSQSAGRLLFDSRLPERVKHSKSPTPLRFMLWL